MHELFPGYSEYSSPGIIQLVQTAISHPPAVQTDERCAMTMVESIFNVWLLLWYL